MTTMRRSWIWILPRPSSALDRPIEVRTLVACAGCDGSGAAEGTSPTVCSICEGIGQVRQVRQSFLGQMVTTAPCARCRGIGEEIAEPCRSCRGEGRCAEHVSLVVRVPPGVDSGATLRLEWSRVRRTSRGTRRRPLCAPACVRVRCLRATRRQPGGGVAGDDAAGSAGCDAVVRHAGRAARNLL